MKKNSKIFIAGATGFTGANLVRRLVADGYTSINILSRKKSDFWRLRGVQSKVHVHEGDVSDIASLRRIAARVRPEYIFHFANAGLVRGASAPDSAVMKVNFFGLVNLLEALASIPYKLFINTGSSSEYGPKRAPMREDMDCEPRNIYGVSKLMATRYATFVARTKKKPIITLRLFSPFGPWDDSRRLIMQSISHFLLGKEPLLGNPKAVRDYVFVGDVIDLYLEAAKKAERLPRGEIFNVGTGKQYAVRDVVLTLAELTGFSNPLHWGKYLTHKEGESPVWRADMRKTFRTFSWRPRRALKKCLTVAVRWMEQHQHFPIHK